MQILYLVHQYLPESVGGVELYTHSLAQAMHERGHRISIFHRRDRRGTGTATRHTDYGSVYSAWNGRFRPAQRVLSTFYDSFLGNAFAEAMAEEQLDLVHVQHLMGLPTGIIRRLLARKVPYVVTLWDFWWICANAQLLTNYSQELCEGPRAYLNCARCALARSGLPQFAPALPLLAAPLAVRNRLLRQVLNGASRLIAPSAFVADWYVDHGIRRERIEILAPGIDVPVSIRQERPVREEEERPLRIGYVGGISWQKGVHVIVEATRDLEGTELWVAGDLGFDPHYSDHLRELAGTNVRFLGQIDRTALGKMLRQIDILAVTSLWYETFAFVISEAHAAGIPVLASNLGVLAERVRHSQDGLLVPPGDVSAWRRALQQMRDNPHLVTRYSAAIQQPPSLEEHAGAIEAVYRKVS